METMKSEIERELQVLRDLTGLHLHGVVQGRRRRKVVVKGEEKEVVSYKIGGADKTYYVDEWDPSSYHNILDDVVMPVSVRTYQKAGGVINVSFVVAKHIEYGEDF